MLIDVNSHTIIGPIYRKGLQEGLEKGLEKGIERGGRRILMTQLRRKYGSVPVRFSQKLKAMPSRQLAEVSMRIFDDVTLEELLG
jgi:hypothetical protein